ncbi:alpha/beta fold hydrolase [Halobacillus naozhouensis]|uniref:Alpha/beta hydrolase n=1 Tax=Halobacillus naozhouensis TaxID=554880 RepID=A0ABY8IUK3_9BACI|nr:alpha/beta hydrolase [Halobacillus naozhouensis]WFT73615.1 alpha/beta hydrolase [Halobacillus naozhouensis]
MKEFNVMVDNHSFKAYEFGDNRLPSLVCLHGMTGDSNSFLELREYLFEDFHIIILDLPGHGETNPLKLERDYRFTSLAKRIYRVIHTLVNSTFYILGHSWGADLALHTAKEFPDKIEGLVLIDGGYVFPEMAEGLTKGKALSGWSEYIESSKYSSWDEIVNTYQEYTTKPWNKKLDSIISSNFIKSNDHYILRADRYSLLATIQAFYSEPCSTTYKNIECPVLLFYSTLPNYDNSRQKGIEKIKNALKKVKVIGIENTKHNVRWDSPERVATEILNWKINLKSYFLYKRMG